VTESASPRAPARLLDSYYAFQAAASCVFYSPVFYVYYQERAGLTVPTILWVQSWFLLVRAALDLPFGALADRYSRRACLVGFALGQIAGSALLLSWPSLPAIVVAETLFAAAGAFKSGADSALLFDSLQAAGRVELYPRAESRAQAVVSLAAGATAIAGGLLAAVDLRLPYVATIVAALASGTLVSAFGGPVEARPSGASAPRLVLEAGRIAARSARVGWVIALAAFAVVGSHVYYYLQQPWLEAVGMPLALFGVVFAGTKAVTALVATVAYRVDTAVGPLGVTAAMGITPALGLSAMSLATGPVAATLLLTRGVLDGLWQPLTNVYLNRLVESRLRATMLSLQSLVARLALALAVMLLGMGTARIGLSSTLAAAGAVAAVVALVLVVTGRRALSRP
jgi:MFS family permease